MSARAKPASELPSGALSVPEWASRLSRLLDGAFTIPGTQIKVGLDPILGLLLPELGDTLTALLAVTLLGVAWKERVPKLVLGRMLFNITLDAVLGAIPLVGDLFDFAFRANERNLALIEQHRRGPDSERSLGDWLVMIGAVGAGLVALAMPIALGVWVLRWLLAL